MASHGVINIVIRVMSQHASVVCEQSGGRGGSHSCAAMLCNGIYGIHIPYVTHTYVNSRLLLQRESPGPSAHICRMIIGVATSLIITRLAAPVCTHSLSSTGKAAAVSRRRGASPNSDPGSLFWQMSAQLIHCAVKILFDERAKFG